MLAVITGGTSVGDAHSVRKSTKKNKVAETYDGMSKCSDEVPLTPSTPEPRKKSAGRQVRVVNVTGISSVQGENRVDFGMGVITPSWGKTALNVKNGRLRGKSGEGWHNRVGPETKRTAF